MVPLKGGDQVGVVKLKLGIVGTVQVGVVGGDHAGVVKLKLGIVGTVQVGVEVTFVLFIATIPSLK